MKHDWEYKPFAEVAEVFNGNSINADYKRNHFQGIKTGLPFIATKDVSFDGIIDYNNGVKIPNYYDYKVAPSGSVFVCAEGGSAGRKVAFITQNVCFGNKLYCISPKDNILNGRYLFLFVQAEVFREQFKTLMTGLIGGVSTKKFKTIVIPIPSMSEQEEIVARLDSAFEKIDTLRHNAEKSLTTAQQLFQSSLTNLLTPQPHWERKTLKDIGKTQTGSTPPMSHKEYYGDYIPFIKPSEINHDGIGGINYATLCISKLGAKHGRVFEIGSIFMVCIGATISKTGISNQVISCNQQINVVTPFKGYSNKYIYYSMCNPNFKSKVIKEGTSAQATLPIISKGKWETLTIDIPPLPEQTAIVAKLDFLSAKVKQLKDNYTRTVALCDEMKQALLKEVFE